MELLGMLCGNGGITSPYCTKQRGKRNMITAIKVAIVIGIILATMPEAY